MDGFFFICCINAITSSIGFDGVGCNAMARLALVRLKLDHAIPLGQLRRNYKCRVHAHHFIGSKIHYAPF